MKASSSVCDAGCVISKKLQSLQVSAQMEHTFRYLWGVCLSSHTDACVEQNFSVCQHVSRCSCLSYHRQFQFFWHAGLSTPWRHQQVAAGDRDVGDINDRMTRVILASNNECIGTAARIQADGLSVSSRHEFLDATGWGEKLEFVASSPHDDIIFLQGKAKIAECSRTAGSWSAFSGQSCPTSGMSSSIHLSWQLVS